jgi:stage III sporulation protein AA
MDIKEITKRFPNEIKIALEAISPSDSDRIQEIRLRVSRPVTVWADGESKTLNRRGGLSLFEADGVIASRQDINSAFESICEYSIHSFQREISEGFITLAGGHRVGLCGTWVTRPESGTVKYISGLNFRIAREVKDCALGLYNSVFAGGLKNLLIAGAPMSGKTTVLRDLCRLLGRKYKLSVIDERGELAACVNGVPQNSIGLNADAFDGYGKRHGIETAIRSMSPQMIICDEIGGAEDLAAIEYAGVSGVKIAAAIHAEDIGDIIKKGVDLKRFDAYAFLPPVHTKGKLKVLRADEVVQNIYGRGADSDIRLGGDTFFVAPEIKAGILSQNGLHA